MSTKQGTSSTTALLLVSLLAVVSTTQAANFNFTAITGSNNASVFECWALTEPLNDTMGLFSASLDVSSATWGIRAPGSNVGAHNAPFPQWIMLLTGAEYFSLPGGDPSNFTLTGDGFGFVLAADTADVSASGHYTSNPGVSNTIALSLPARDGLVPNHTVVHDGPCTSVDFSGYSS